MPYLKQQNPSATERDDIPSLESLHKHLQNDFTASLYLWLNKFVPDHTGESCGGAGDRQLLQSILLYALRVRKQSIICHLGNH